MCFYYNLTKFVSAVFDNVLEYPCHCSTHDCVLVSIKFGSNAGGEVEGLCKGTMLTEKAKCLRQKQESFVKGMQENNILHHEESLICPLDNAMVFEKSKLKNLVSEQTCGTPSGCPILFDSRSLHRIQNNQLEHSSLEEKKQLDFGGGHFLCLLFE